MWSQLHGRATVCLTVRPYFQTQPRFQPSATVSRPTEAALPYFTRAVQGRHYRPTIKSQKTAHSVAGVEPTTFRTAATDDDKDQRLYRNCHRGLYLHLRI